METKSSYLERLSCSVTKGALKHLSLDLFFEAREFFSQDNRANSSPSKSSSTLLCHSLFPSNTKILSMLFPPKKCVSLQCRSSSLMIGWPLQLELPATFLEGRCDFQEVYFAFGKWCWDLLRIDLHLSCSLANWVMWLHQVWTCLLRTVHMPLEEQTLRGFTLQLNLTNQLH